MTFEAPQICWLTDYPGSLFFGAKWIFIIGGSKAVSALRRTRCFENRLYSGRHQHTKKGTVCAEKRRQSCDGSEAGDFQASVASRHQG